MIYLDFLHLGIQFSPFPILRNHQYHFNGEMIIKFPFLPY